MPDNVMSLTDKIDPGSELTLIEWIEQLRDIFEEGPEDSRPTHRGIAALMLVRKSDKYEVNQAAFVPEVPDLGVVMSIIGGIYTSNDEHDAVVVVTDSWGLPLHLRDQQAIESQKAFDQLSHGEITPDEYAARYEAFRGKWGMPADYPEDQRTEVSTYVSAANDGSFIAAEQLRGKEHDLYWYGGADSPEPEHVWLDDQLSQFIRLIVDKSNRKEA